MSRMLKFQFLISCILCFQAEIKAQSYFPPQGNQWESEKASSFNIDQKTLDEAIEFAQNNEYSGSVDLRQAILKGFEYEPFHKILGPTKKRGGPAGMIIKNGYQIASWGDINRVDMTFSVTKSYLSTIAGLAFDQQLIFDVDQKVGESIWDGTFEGAHNQKVTWDHLLTQSSDWSGMLWGGKDWADRPPKDGGLNEWEHRKYNEPGSVFEYNDVRVNVLAYSLLQTWRKPLPQVLKQYVMDPIGASTTWRWFGYENSWTNVDGVNMQSVSGGGHSGGGLFINTMDHARFGLLFLNDGRWKGEEILSKKWIEKATTSSQANDSYGYMWWLNKGQRKWDGVEDESIFYGAGFGGNYIIVDKNNDLVVVLRWLEPNKLDDFMSKLYDSFPK